MAVEMEQIREALVVNLASIPDCQKNAYRMENPTPPALLVVGFDPITPETMDDSDGEGASYSFEMLIQGIAGKPLAKSAQQRLDRWILPSGDESVWRAIKSRPDLGGIIEDLDVLACDGSQFFTLENGTVVLGSTWHLKIQI